MNKLEKRQAIGIAVELWDLDLYAPGLTHEEAVNTLLRALYDTDEIPDNEILSELLGSEINKFGIAR